eukprot:c993_g1_i1.p1 GENE.c993_g1_i1~~c993_g1_i1.p1  ORF type:complete len:600 (+),score=102.88 c993_g1_i1:104-1801(+)
MEQQIKEKVQEISQITAQQNKSHSNRAELWEKRSALQDELLALMALKDELMALKVEDLSKQLKTQTIGESSLSKPSLGLAPSSAKDKQSFKNQWHYSPPPFHPFARDLATLFYSYSESTSTCTINDVSVDLSAIKGRLNPILEEWRSLFVDKNLGCFANDQSLASQEVFLSTRISMFLQRLVGSERIAVCHQSPTRYRQSRSSAADYSVFLLKHGVATRPLLASDCKLADFEEAVWESRMYTWDVQALFPKKDFPILLSLPMTANKAGLEVHFPVVPASATAGTCEFAWSPITHSVEFDNDDDVSRLLVALFAGISALAELNAVSFPFKASTACTAFPNQGVPEACAHAIAIGNEVHKCIHRLNPYSFVRQWKESPRPVSEEFETTIQVIKSMYGCPLRDVKVEAMGPDMCVLKYQYIAKEETGTKTGKHFLDILQAIEHLHAKGIVHGDIRISNMIFNANGGSLIDYDFAGKNGEHKYPSQYNVAADYNRHPEAKPDSALEFKHDLYSMGVIMEKFQPPITTRSNVAWNEMCRSLKEGKTSAESAKKTLEDFRSVSLQQTETSK